MNRKPATLETIRRRSRRALRAAGALTTRGIARQQAAMDREIAREGRVGQLAAEQADEMAAARMRAAVRMADTATDLAALALTRIAAEAATADSKETLEDVAKAATTSQIRYRVWRGAKETRVYVEQYNGSKSRPWIAKGHYIVDEASGTSRCEADRRGPVEAFETALATFLTK